jgi:hypothetical protein
MWEFGPGLFAMIVFYMGLNAARDFRDNFAPELWASFGYYTAPSLFATSEGVVGVAVMGPIIIFMLIRSNIRALTAYHVVIIAGMVAAGTVANLYESGGASGFAFMVVTGIGIHLAYVPFSNIIFELILATFKYKANSGFLMYLCDSLGYVTSLIVVLVRDFGAPHIYWDHFYVNICYTMAGSGILLMGFSLMYYLWRYRGWRGGVLDTNEPPLLGAEIDEANAVEGL